MHSGPNSNDEGPIAKVCLLKVALSNCKLQAEQLWLDLGKDQSHAKIFMTTGEHIDRLYFYVFWQEIDKPNRITCKVY